VAWVWVALDADTRRVVAVVVGDRSEFTADCLGLSLPDEDREHALFCTGFVPAYRAVIPGERHAAPGRTPG
jgi:insertion element IS1 protein InsB